MSPSTPTALALATTFARRQSDAPASALLDGAQAILSQAGAPSGTGLVLDAHLDRERLHALLPLLEARRELLPCLAIEHSSGLVGAPALAALDKEESRSAVVEAEATLRRAAAIGASYVVLRLGWVDGARRDWIYARDRFLRGALGERLRRGLVEARDKVAHGHLDRARAAVDRLCRLADGLGVTVLLKNGQRYVELPSPRELDLLRADLRGAPLAPLFDLPAAHLADAMGLLPMALTEAAFGDAPLVYAGDACAAIGALPVGAGELGRDGVRSILSRRSPDAVRVFRPWPGLTEPEVALGLTSLR